MVKTSKEQIDRDEKLIHAELQKNTHETTAATNKEKNSHIFSSI